MRPTHTAPRSPKPLPLKIKQITPALSAVTFLLSLVIWTDATAVDLEEGLSGEVNIGGSVATGNTDTARLDAEMKARFKTGRLEDNYRLLEVVPLVWTV